MRLLPLALLALLASTAASAKPWQGITPGASNRAAVIGKFGQPSKTTTTGGREVLAYKDPSKGTAQAQFELSASGVVDRIVIFPAVKVGREAIEAGYGPRCQQGPQHQTCYLERKTRAGKLYLEYPLLGLIVFFSEDGQQVESMLFKRELT